MRLRWRLGKKFILIYFVLGFLAIATFFFIFSSFLFQELEDEISLRSRIFAKYMSKEGESEFAPSAELDIIFEEVIKKIDFPVIVTDDKGEVSAYRNIGKNLTKERLNKIIKKLEKERPPIPLIVNIGDTTKFLGEIYYGLSDTAKFIRLYPYWQIFFLIVFLLLGAWSIFVYKKREEERLWTFLAKETAHQIATPLSSLLGWVSALKNSIGKSYYEEMMVDVKKMEMALERFSRIGLPPKLTPVPIELVIQEVLKHFQKRIPAHITLVADLKDEVVLNLDEVLFAWSLENLLKNSVDAIGEKPGKIEIKELVNSNSRYYEIQISDTGEGVDKKIRDKIFRPGITTKRVGWGIGLSLSKRIIEEYHKGKLLLRESKKGNTVFSILLPR